MELTHEQKLQAYRDLDSRICAACGEKKRRRHSFCLKCYDRLTPAHRARIYERVGYAETYTEALQYLQEAKGRALGPLLESMG
jgi:predicted amidophosphoribosyltransferase